MTPISGHEEGHLRFHPQHAPIRVFPLNSKRLTSQYVMSIAKAMDMPMKGTTKLIIEGKLTEMSRDPRNVQVEVGEGDSGRTTVYLCDSRGAFLEAECSTAGEFGTEDNGSDTSLAGGGALREKQTDLPSDEEGAAELEEARVQNSVLSSLNDELTAQVSSLEGEVSTLAENLKKESERVNEVWRMSCDQVSCFDEIVTSKDAEIERLKARIIELETSRVDPLSHRDSDRRVPPHPTTVALSPIAVTRTAPSAPRRGKAPPISEFTGEDPDCTLDDWLPSLERAIMWNSWTEEEQIIQLAGHLKSRALQEWNLLSPEEKVSFSRGVEALRARLDYGGKALAAQDFRHLAQQEAESVADFVRRLERTFRIAYGRDHMSLETKSMLLYGQLQDEEYAAIRTAPRRLEFAPDEISGRVRIYQLSRTDCCSQK